MEVLNKDLKDFITELNRCTVDYILVEGYAVMLRGYREVPATWNDIENFLPEEKS